MTDQKIRVLVVDDQAPIREAVIALLEETDVFEVAGEACNGAEAVDAVATLTPDVVLMDLRMPVMDGVDATRRIASTGSSAPVLIHSAYGDDSLVLEALQAGARGYIVKGSALSDLLGGLKHVVAGQSHISDEVTRPLINRLMDSLNRERETRVEAERAADLLTKTAAQQREFAMQASHELRTPLTSLMGALEMLEDPSVLASDDVIALVTTAMDGARRFARLAANLEVIATGEGLRVIPEPTPLAPIVEDVVRDLNATDRVNVDVAQLGVSADPARLRQILFNVIQNALAVRASDQTVDVTATMNGDEVEMRVSDRGPGFDPEVVADLYEPFHHKIGSACGLGVGLAVVRELMDRMDGSLIAEDRAGGGATVSLTLKAVLP